MVKNSILLLFFVFLYLSCFPIVHNYDTLTIKNSKISNIKTDGYYFSKYKLNKDYHSNKGEFIRMKVLLNNGYFHYVQNGFGKECGDTISIECAIKMSEYMLDKNINEFLVDSNDQKRPVVSLWNWGKYEIKGDSIKMQWFYNRFGDYYLAEENGIVIDSTSFKLTTIKDYSTGKISTIDEIYQFKPYNIEKIYNKIPTKLKSK